MFCYGDFAQASKHALEREEKAKTMFRNAKQQFDVAVLPQLTQPNQTFTLMLLTPDIHLTSVTYGTFHKWVKEHEGWKLKRRQATPEDCKHHGAYNRGKSYWIDAVYKVPDPNKKPPKATAKKKKKQANDDDDQKPASKKVRIIHEPPKNRIGPFPFFEQLATDLQQKILSYSDIPTLGALAVVSKSLNQLAKEDHCWIGHLKFLLQELFDGAYGKGRDTTAKTRKDDDDNIVPISQRPLKSTEFFAWLRENQEGKQCITINNDSVTELDLNMIEYVRSENADAFSWLFTDVSLKEYFKQAGLAAVDGEKHHFTLMEDSNRCPYCCCKIFHGCRCRRGKMPVGMFDNLPPLRLFRW